MEHPCPKATVDLKLGGLQRKTVGAGTLIGKPALLAVLSRPSRHPLLRLPTAIEAPLHSMRTAELSR